MSTPVLDPSATPDGVDAPTAIPSQPTPHAQPEPVLPEVLEPVRGGARRAGLGRRVRGLGGRLRGGLDRRLTGPPRAVRPSDEPAVLISSAFTMIALVCLWAAAQLLVLSDLGQARAQDLLYGQLRSEIAAGTAPLGPITPVDAPVALLRIPRIGVDQVVVEGTASGDTQAGPGHLRTSVLPGQQGTSVVLGRAATYGAPFARITELRAGDQIQAVTGQGTTTFTVLDVRRAGDPLPQPRAATAARITLVTAEGSGALASLRPDQAVYVDAEAAKGLPAPAGVPTVLPESEQVMAGDRGGLPLLALCLALLLAATLGVAAARQRWSAALVWVVTAPVVIALSWVTTDVAARLLPNVL